MVDRAVGENPVDWTSFDVGRSLRMLRVGNSAQITRELRKLHLRWWHAPRVPMERVLSAAGLPPAIIARVADVVETCRECRIWRRPGPSPSTTVELATKQNVTVEADIIFYKDKMAWHMVDKADRFETDIEIHSKSSTELCEAISVSWIAIFGPFQHLVVDGEMGIQSEETVRFLKRHGIEVRARAPGQHAQMAELRGAILRHCLHCTEEQLVREGITVTFRQLLAECVFANNALVSHDGATPYHARFGTTPSMLPDPWQVPDDTTQGPGRHLHRVREVASNIS